MKSIITFLLQIVRIPLLLFWMFVAMLLLLPFMFDSWICVRAGSRVAYIWAYGLAKILNLKIEVFGDRSSFQGGLIASNHMGYLDIITHASIFPLRFSPKAEIKKWPFMGWFVGLNHPVWIERDSKQKSKDALLQFQETMDHGIPLIVYPEGTSSDGKSGILPFKSTPFEAVVPKNHPVLPIMTLYRERKEDPTVCWYGDMTLLPHVWRLLGIPSIEVEVHILPPIKPDGRSRKELAAEVHRVLSDAYNTACAKAV